MKIFCKKCIKAIETDIPEGVKEIQCPVCSETLQVPESPLSPGAVIGDFYLEKALSSGGMGVVYLARQISLDRPVALKVLREKYAQNREYIDGLFREARAAATLTHPNIVQAYAVGEENGIFYFAMEYIRGETFKEILKREKVLDFDQAVKVIREVCSALQAAWTEQTLVHQDIKPENIMLASNGYAKLADLGLARRANRDSGPAEDEKEVMGTPQYISPEQLTGVPTDVRSDIYSLGATFYHFVTGQFPYPEKDTMELLRRHAKGDLTPPIEVNPQLPQALSDIIVKMMARNIEARYQLPNEVIADLDAYTAQKKMAAAPMPKITLNLNKKNGTAPKPAVPGAKPAVPGAKPAVPGAKPAVPGAKPAVPGAKPAVPGVKPAVPRAKPAVPGAKPAGPAVPPAAAPAAKPAVQAAPPATAPAAKPAVQAAPPAAAPVAAPAAAPVAAPAAAPVAAPAAAPVAAPAAAPVAAPAAAPVATPAAKPATPVLAPVAAPVAEPVEAPEAAPIEDMKKKKAKKQKEESSKKLVFSILFILFDIIVLAAAFFVSYKGILGEKAQTLALKAANSVGIKLAAPQAEAKADTNTGTAAAASQTPEAPPAPVTRKKFISEADRLGNYYRNNPKEKEFVTKLVAEVERFKKEFLPCVTKEEEEAFAALKKINIAADELLAHYYREHEIEKIAAVWRERKEQQEQAKRQREEQLRAQEEHKRALEEQSRKQAAEEAVRLKALETKLDGMYTELVNAFIKSVLTNDPNFYRKAAEAQPDITLTTPSIKESSLRDDFTFFRSTYLPNGLKEFQAFRTKLQLITPQNSFYAGDDLTTEIVRIIPHSKGIDFFARSKKDRTKEVKIRMRADILRDVCYRLTKDCKISAPEYFIAFFRGDAKKLSTNDNREWKKYMPRFMKADHFQKKSKSKR